MTGSRSTVKPSLRTKRGKRVVENYEYAKFTRRVLKAYSRRVADGDVEFLRCMAALVSGLPSMQASTRLSTGRS